MILKMMMMIMKMIIKGIENIVMTIYSIHASFPIPRKNERNWINHTATKVIVMMMILTIKKTRVTNPKILKTKPKMKTPKMTF